MALQEMAPIALRPHRAWLIAVAAAGTAGGGRMRSPSSVAASGLHVARAPSRPPAPTAARALERRRQQPAPAGSARPDRSRPNRPSTSRAGGLDRIHGPQPRLTDRIDPLVAARRPRRAGPQGLDRRRARSRHAPVAIGQAAQLGGPSSSSPTLEQGPALQGPGSTHLVPWNTADGVRTASATGTRPPGQHAGAAPDLPGRVGRQRALLSQQGRPALEVHRPAPQRQCLGQLRPDRRRAPQGAGLRRLRLPLRDRQRDGHRTTARSRSPSGGSTRSTASTAGTPRTPRSTSTASASASSATWTRSPPRPARWPRPRPWSPT